MLVASTVSFGRPDLGLRVVGGRGERLPETADQVGRALDDLVRLLVRLDPDGRQVPPVIELDVQLPDAQPRAELDGVLLGEVRHVHQLDRDLGRGLAVRLLVGGRVRRGGGGGGLVVGRAEEPRRGRGRLVDDLDRLALVDGDRRLTPVALAALAAAGGEEQVRLRPVVPDPLVVIAGVLVDDHPRTRGTRGAGGGQGDELPHAAPPVPEFVGPKWTNNCRNNRRGAA
jgi:hypothetical protein